MNRKERRREKAQSKHGERDPRTVIRENWPQFAAYACPSVMIGARSCPLARTYASAPRTSSLW
jgi:hypothetical protein